MPSLRPPSGKQKKTHKGIWEYFASITCRCVALLHLNVDYWTILVFMWDDIMFLLDTGKYAKMQSIRNTKYCKEMAAKVSCTFLRNGLRLIPLAGRKKKARNKLQSLQDVLDNKNQTTTTINWGTDVLSVYRRLKNGTPQKCSRESTSREKRKQAFKGHTFLRFPLDLMQSQGRVLNYSIYISTDHV